MALPGPRIDITGKRFHHLLVLEYQSNGNWLCVCDCGEKKILKGSHLRAGSTKSCGCKRKEMIGNVQRTHGFCGHPLYDVYMAMVRRCTCKEDSQFLDYGGRGIEVCPRWSEINKFFEDMLPSYSRGLILDRIDVNGPYSPENCRWVSKSVSNHNIRPRKGSSRFKGVSFNCSVGKWQAAASKEGKVFFLGSFESEEEAARAYDKAVVEIYGDLASINGVGGQNNS